MFNLLMESGFTFYVPDFLEPDMNVENKKSRGLMKTALGFWFPGWYLNSGTTSRPRAFLPIDAAPPPGLFDEPS
jgi:hypothetical protein